MSALRENWRIVLLVVLLLGSTVALFVPGAPPGTAANETAGGEQLTNLQYGIDLSGGARIEAPVVGKTAEGIDVGNQSQEAPAQQAIANQLGIDPIDIEVRAAQQVNQNGTVEVFDENVTTDEFRTALQAEGYQPATIREGVTPETRQRMVTVIQDKITTSALSGGRVQEVNSPGGRNFISITAPGRDAQDLIDILEERGTVRVYAVYQNSPTGNWTQDEVLQQNDFRNIGNAQTVNNQPQVPVVVRQNAAEQFQSDMSQAGFGSGARCGVEAGAHDSVDTINATCLVTTLNGEPVFIGGVEPSLGQSFADGTFANDPQFVMTTTSMQDARDLQLSLQAGRLPADLDFEDGTQNSLSPALADQFRSNSLITGLLAVLAVSLVVYGRYRRREVALPMIVTALSEVYILLGFVALAQYPLNLSHLAGFIAVIGTGVDDLIIIGDEILQQGEVGTARVFQSRFRKAFWVIGAAAATTIVAMVPLVGFPLGDLSGFAIITIVGVLIGVLVTRPAYGDILRSLVLDE